MQLKEILSTLQEHKSLLQERFSVKEIGVFGSYARGTATENSDIDFFVVFEHKHVDNITGLWIYLEDLFDKKVDLIHQHKRLRNGLKREIDKEIVYG
jgi:predicted nucleotidyltransferase